MPILPELKLLWENIKNIPDKINKLIELLNANGAVFLDADGNYRIVPFGNGLGQIAEGNHQHSKLALTNSDIATSTTTGALTLPGLGLGGGNMHLNEAINFAPTTNQKINLWADNYAIGIQNSTCYFRTAVHFAFYRGGSHVSSSLSPGGGTRLLWWDNTNQSWNMAGTLNANISNGVTGSFISSDGKTITVNKGIVIGIV